MVGNRENATIVISLGNSNPIIAYNHKQDRRAWHYKASKYLLKVRLSLRKLTDDAPPL
ncbi:hypothetical protein CL55_00009000 [Polynucleobacter duraquae]|uniref:Uncharacterized protein n=1 Tax=Polynucleobacter duraquae TaxID=1835254 RepID=A0A0E3V173_9BURK|nr:hypothetical protein CL55_00009000 [Polynucleobacter duraquae]